MSAEPAEEGHQLISPTVPPVYWWAKHIELAVLQWESIFAKMHCSSERNQSGPLPWQWKVSVTQSQPQLWQSFFTLSLSTHFAQGYPIPLLQPCMYKLFSFGDQERSFSIISNCIQVSTKSHSNAGITQVNHMSPEYFLSFIKLYWIHRKQLWLKKLLTMSITHTCPVFHSPLSMCCWLKLETGYWATQTSGLMQHDCSFVRYLLSLRFRGKGIYGWHSSSKDLGWMEGQYP